MLLECALKSEPDIRGKFSEEVIKNELPSGNMVSLWRIKVKCIGNRKMIAL